MNQTAKSKKILIVDDDEDICELMVTLVADLGHSSEIARNGEECLKKIKLHTPDLVIMDIRMPLMDGITTLKHMRDGNQQVPVLVYSGFLDDDTLKLSHSLGAKAAYSKPLSESDLIQAIALHAR